MHFWLFGHSNLCRFLSCWVAATVFFFFFFFKLLLLSLEHRKLCRDYRRRGRDDDIGIIYSLVCSPAESVSPPCAYCDAETDRRCSRYNTFSVPTAMDRPEIRLLQLIWGVCVCACSDSSTALQYAHVRACVRGSSVWGADILAFFFVSRNHACFFSRFRDSITQMTVGVWTKFLLFFEASKNETLAPLTLCVVTEC